MVEFGEWLCSDVLKYVPHRQWVFSPPKADVPYSKTATNLFHVRSQSSGKTKSLRMKGNESIFEIMMNWPPAPLPTRGASRPASGS